MTGMLVRTSISSASRSMPAGTSCGPEACSPDIVVASQTMFLPALLLLVWIAAATGAVEMLPVSDSEPLGVLTDAASTLQDFEGNRSIQAHSESSGTRSSADQRSRPDAVAV